MANIWRKDDSHREQPNRNVIDLSFQNNLTLDFGYLYPVVVQPTIPGDSYEIKPTFALNFESMVFPIQTRMRSYLHFFKVRNRTLWKDWEDFIGKNKQGLEVPYIDESITKARTGKLLDYLGVPTTIVGTYGNNISLLQGDVANLAFTDFSFDYNSSTTNIPDTVDELKTLYLSHKSFNVISPNYNRVARIFGGVSLSTLKTIPKDARILYVSNNSSGTLTDYTTPLSSDGAVITKPTPISSLTLGNFVYGVFSKEELSFDVGSSFTLDSEFITPIVSSNTLTFDLTDSEYLNDRSVYKYFYIISFSTIGYVPTGVSGNAVYAVSRSVGTSFDISYRLIDNVIDIDDETSPYWRSNDTRDKETIKLRALRPRAYEAIYNSFYRNAENNPYKINGVEEYNKYIPTDDGGLDTNLYKLRRRNWEDDFLTTALPMPQAGIAPLVGLTGTAGAATVTIANSDGETVVANAQVDEDGNIISLSTDASSNLASSLLDTVTYGISINDLRNVNAFQRWLEAKARGGYKYRDQIETLFGVTVRYDTLDMPEFIGGMSLDVFVNQITQTVNVSPSSPLGDIAGQASCIGTGERITEYCDEHGYIIGILSVVPVPNYSQLLDKDWFKSDAFDYFFPQFGHIGMQPITYKEVCPVQAFQESTGSDNVLEDTFGYQRAWYDYLARTDEVHGHFRSTLRDFVMNRTFDVKPELSESFLLVDNEQLNDVFAITDNSVPKIRGQIYFDMKGKRPIPLYGIPKLE